MAVGLQWEEALLDRQVHQLSVPSEDYSPCAPWKAETAAAVPAQFSYIALSSTFCWLYYFTARPKMKAIIYLANFISLYQKEEFIMLPIPG